MNTPDKDPNEATLKRRLRFDAAIERLCANEDFQRFVSELLIMQPLDDAGFSDNPTVMAYNNGRRSVMIDIKRLIPLEAWHFIESYNVND